MREKEREREREREQWGIDFERDGCFYLCLQTIQDLLLLLCLYVSESLRERERERESLVMSGHPCSSKRISEIFRSL